ncbi:mechanosensitive ion channel family protein [Gloeothece verrucosa]|uniref:MscS Mechanosensitive ion channel n=1 Tax=Gloeothece verrucosa (strain PCC 7822) TaxID=497965 RepID=E0UIN2_GLOV7|nr:mechanosensitive ion channel family protein [Gloeothece verrucosa]ADN12226.1 MscS Mechanosensitive ion channel [Gloeothece verrucosa PCC 7822]
MNLKRLKIQFASVIIAGVILVTGFFLVAPVFSQIPIPLNNITKPTPNNQKPDAEKTIISQCVELQGRCLFKIAGEKADLSSRVEEIEQRLQDLNQTYAHDEKAQLKINQEQVGNLRDIYASIGYKEFRLMTVTNLDANLEKVDIAKRADQIVEQLKQGLERAKLEQQASFIYRQAIIALGIGAAMIISSFMLARWKQKLKRSLAKVEPSKSLQSGAVKTELDRRQKWHIKEVQYRLVQLTSGAIWSGGILLILGLFPQTRATQGLLIAGLKIPIRVTIIALITYLAIRLSYALIARFTKVITNHSLIYPENRRLELRVKTISSITKSVITIICIGIGILITLSAVGLDIGPVLAGAGIIGLAVSFASQNLIKDALNGFLIIFEDQYAVGDVIAVGNFSGLVENINLRITQLRDSEGRLITIPNSEIKAVANLSSQWSRADLAIPVAYKADLNKALDLISKTAQQMNQEPSWKKYILEPPEVLGVDNFDDRGVIIRVWIKTQPLKQWEVSREFRRRLKTTFDQAGIPIPPPQQELWFDSSVWANIEESANKV